VRWETGGGQTVFGHYRGGNGHWLGKCKRVLTNVNGMYIHAVNKARGKKDLNRMKQGGGGGGRGTRRNYQR